MFLTCHVYMVNILFCKLKGFGTCFRLRNQNHSYKMKRFGRKRKNGKNKRKKNLIQNIINRHQKKKNFLRKRYGIFRHVIQSVFKQSARNDWSTSPHLITTTIDFSKILIPLACPLIMSLLSRYRKLHVVIATIITLTPWYFHFLHIVI